MNQDFLKASDFDEKTVFRKSKIVGKLAIKDYFIWSIYTKKTSKLAFCAFLEKLFRKKLFFFFIKVFFVSNFLKIISFWINCCKTRHILNQKFQMRQTWSHFFTTRQKSNRITLERFRFRKKVLQRIRFWSEIVFKKADFDENFAFRKLFLDRFTPKKICSHAFSENQQFLKKKLEKNSFASRAFAKNQILKKVFNNASGSNQDF